MLWLRVFCVAYCLCTSIVFRFVGGELNTCYNCIDRHVERGFGNQAAIIHDSPVTNTIRKITYKELMTEVNITLTRSTDQECSRIGQKGKDCPDKYCPYLA